tara:strand:+ start:1827 stop:2756 length:930 start_codon:yes stop_codon:yes gene_type:complete
MKILVTGAGGFFGKNLVSLLASNYKTIPAYSSSFKENKQDLAFEIRPDTDWEEILQDIDIVIHLAARAHIMNKKERNSFDYDSINNLSSINLAKYASESFVKKFIFISTVKVSGEHSPPHTSLNTSDINRNLDPYSKSKFDAEEGIKKVFSNSNTDLIIIRPPLIYGPGVKGNFRLLINLIKSQIPTPLGSINNKRSLVSTYNFIDFIEHCINFDKKINDTFFVSDGDDISTPELIKLIANSLNKKPRLFNFNIGVLKVFSRIIGKEDQINRLSDNLVIDIDKNYRLLGWKPKFAVSDSLNKMFLVEQE